MVDMVDMMRPFYGLGGTYGPFQLDDVATIPAIHAKGLFVKDAIVAVHLEEEDR